MRKLIVTAALLGAMFSAKAQTINVINQCGEKTRIINFTRTDAYSSPLQYYRIASHCVKEEYPTYKLEVGNYEFEDLNVPEYEQWHCEIKKAGKVIRKGFLTLNRFYTIMSEDMTIEIVISPKPQCGDCK